MDSTDNLYPNDGAFFSSTIPEDQAVDAEKEQKQVEDLAPVLKDSINLLAERIAFYSSIDAIDDEITLDTEAFMHTIAAYKIVKAVLEQEKNRLEVLYSAHIDE